MTVEEVRKDGVDRCLGLCPECAREPQEGSERGGGVRGMEPRGQRAALWAEGRDGEPGLGRVKEFKECLRCSGAEELMEGGLGWLRQCVEGEVGTQEGAGTVLGHG